MKSSEELVEGARLMRRGLVAGLWGCEGSLGFTREVVVSASICARPALPARCCVASMFSSSVLRCCIRDRFAAEAVGFGRAALARELVIFVRRGRGISAVYGSRQHGVMIIVMVFDGHAMLQKRHRVTEQSDEAQK